MRLDWFAQILHLLKDTIELEFDKSAVLLVFQVCVAAPLVRRRFEVFLVPPLAVRQLFPARYADHLCGRLGAASRGDGRP